VGGERNGKPLRNVKPRKRRRTEPKSEQPGNAIEYNKQAELKFLVKRITRGIVPHIIITKME